MNKRFAVILLALTLLLATAAWSWDFRLITRVLPTNPAPAKTVAQIDVPLADTTPTIDGVIDLGSEWADAAVVNITGERNMNVYFLADNNFLYLAYDLLDNTDLLDGDAAIFLFDNNNDDAWPPDCPGTKEGLYAMAHFYGLMNEYYTTIYDDGGTPNACQPNNPTESVQSAVSFSTKGNVQIEVRMDFTDDQLYGAADATIGIALGEVNNDSDAFFWPAEIDPDNIDPVPFADMTYPSFTGDDDTGDDDTGDDDTGDDDTGDDDTDDDDTDDDTDDDDTDDDDTDDDDTDDDDDDDYIPPIDDDDDDDDNDDSGDDNLSGSRSEDNSSGGCS